MNHPPLTPTTFYETCQQALLAKPWDMERDARYIYEPVSVLPATSDLPGEVPGEVEVHDYFHWEARDWTPTTSLKARKEQEQTFLAAGNVALNVNFYVPTHRAGNDNVQPVSYLTLRPSAAAPNSFFLRYLVYGDIDDDGTIYRPPLLDQNSEQWNSHVVVKASTNEGSSHTYELLDTPAADPQLLVVYNALHQRLRKG